jgi:CheY-like chemotaxis protein
MAEILVIDDMNGVRRALTSMLKSVGHAVTTADNGKQAMELLKQRSFNLVITDILMPEVDGMEVIMHLTSMPTRPPVIAISGGGAGMSSELALRGAKLKADAFLEKPFEKKDLLAAVDKLLAKKAAA